MNQESQMRTGNGTYWSRSIDTTIGLQSTAILYIYTVVYPHIYSRDLGKQQTNQNKQLTKTTHATSHPPLKYGGGGGGALY